MSNWFTVAHVLGAVQGLFLAALLWTRRARLANRILAVAMLACAFDLAIAVYHQAGWESYAPHLIGLDFPLTFLYGPLLYLYARSLSRGEETLHRSDWWHVVPFGLLVLLMLPFYLQGGAEKLQFLADPSEDPLTSALYLASHAKIPHALCYVAAILLLLRQHRRRLKENYSDVERLALTWLRNLALGILAFATIATIIYVLSLRDVGPVLGIDPSNDYDDYMLLCLAAFVYAIGFIGLRQFDVLGSQPPAESGKPLYARSGMTPASAARYKTRLLQTMETEKPYLRRDLTLNQLAKIVEISPHNLTEVINTQLGQSFHDLVNGYRVAECRNRLGDPANDHLTLLAIALESGFNSKSAFNAAFKKHARMPPSHFRSQRDSQTRQTRRPDPR